MRYTLRISVIAASFHSSLNSFLCGIVCSYCTVASTRCNLIYADSLCLNSCVCPSVHPPFYLSTYPGCTLKLPPRRRMPLPRFPFVAAATTSAKKTATSEHGGWRAFSFLKKVANDDWHWSALANMLSSHLEQSPDSRPGIERMGLIALGGCLAFWMALAAFTYFIWRRKSRAMRERIAVLTGYNAVLAGTNDVLTRCLQDAEETIGQLSERTHVKAW